MHLSQLSLLPLSVPSWVLSLAVFSLSLQHLSLSLSPSPSLYLCLSLSPSLSLSVSLSLSLPGSLRLCLCVSHVLRLFVSLCVSAAGSAAAPISFSLLICLRCIPVAISSPQRQQASTLPRGAAVPPPRRAATAATATAAAAASGGESAAAELGSSRKLPAVSGKGDTGFIGFAAAWRLAVALQVPCSSSRNRSLSFRDKRRDSSRSRRSRAARRPGVQRFPT